MQSSLSNAGGESHDPSVSSVPNGAEHCAQTPFVCLWRQLFPRRLGLKNIKDKPIRRNILFSKSKKIKEKTPLRYRCKIKFSIATIIRYKKENENLQKNPIPKHFIGYRMISAAFASVSCQVDHNPSFLHLLYNCNY